MLLPNVPESREVVGRSEASYGKEGRKAPGAENGGRWEWKEQERGRGVIQRTGCRDNRGGRRNGGEKRGVRGGGGGVGLRDMEEREEKG